MSIFPRKLQKELFQIYLQSFLSIGLSKRQATHIVKNMLSWAKETSLKQKTYMIPPNFGDYIVSGNLKDFPGIIDNIEFARSEGATDDDIRQWWNMNDLERYMIIANDNHFNMVKILEGIESGKEKIEAIEDIKKYTPIYGPPPKNISKSKGKDEPLPYELKDRINKYIEEYNIKNPSGEELKKKWKSYSSFNVLIRDEIKKGNL